LFVDHLFCGILVIAVWKIISWKLGYWWGQNNRLTNNDSLVLWSIHCIFLFLSIKFIFPLGYLMSWKVNKFWIFLSLYFNRFYF
jgi:hypothetical protein